MFVRNLSADLLSRALRVKKITIQSVCVRLVLSSENISVKYSIFVVVR